MWSNELEVFELKFIENFQAEPILWDCKHRNYKDEGLNQDAWNRIGQLMDIPVSELKKKKESFFASYRKYRKMVKDSTRSGAGENDIYKPIWFAYDVLDSFLGDGLTPRTTINTISSPRQPPSPEEGINNEIPETSNTTRTLQNSRPRSLQKEVKEAGKNVEKALSLFEETFKKREAQDDSEIYAMGLAKKLRAFSEEERLEIMYEIDGFIINRRRARHSSRFSNAKLSPLSQNLRSSSAQSTYSEPMSSNTIYRQNTRMIYSEPPQIHIPEEQYTEQEQHFEEQYSEPIDVQTGPVQIISNELLTNTQLSAAIADAFKKA